MRLNGEVSSAEFAVQKKRIESEVAVAHTAGRPQMDIGHDFDIESAFDEAEPVLSEPSKFWQALPEVWQKREFQKVILTQHTAYNPTVESFGTAKLSRLFRVFEGSNDPDAYDVAGAGFEPATFGF
jgi:hypothetical protein